jgi:hypothetical protein
MATLRVIPLDLLDTKIHNCIIIYIHLLHDGTVSTAACNESSNYHQRYYVASFNRFSFQIYWCCLQKDAERAPLPSPRHSVNTDVNILYLTHL